MERPDTAELYFEAHITIDPVFDNLRAIAEDAAKSCGFKLAKLLMQKGAADKPEASQLDTFMTGHSKSLSDLKTRMEQLIWKLQLLGFNVRRYKIEDTVLDSRYADVLGVLDVKR